MKILITGGSGFIGSALTDSLIKRGHETAVFDNFTNFISKPKYYQAALKHREILFKNKPVKIYRSSILDINKLKTAFSEFKPDTVVHLAGLPMARPLPEFADQEIPINLTGTVNVFEAFEKSDAKKMVYTSSSMAYGHFKMSPQPEDVILNPINAYGAAKAAGEYFLKLSKKEWVIVRPTSVYGYTDCANRVTQLLLDAALTGKNAWVVKGETLDFSYIDDVVSGFIKCIESPNAVFQIFNISRGQQRTASDFAEIVKKYFPAFSYEVREPTVQQVYRGALDISRAKKLLNFNPEYSIEKGIEKILSLVKTHQWVKDAF